MKKRNVVILLAAAVVFSWVGKSFADYVYRDGNGSLQTIFAFTCFASKICPAQVLMDSAGAEKATTANPLSTRQTSQYPTSATPITASTTGTTGATAATLASGSSLTTYICGFSIRANATSAATGNSTVGGTITGTLNFTQWTAPNAAGLGVTEMIFSPCVPASATNTTIVVTSAAAGAGGVVSVAAWGYTQ